ncbi:MAG: RloB domain-containing protein [Atopobiaceae bacterium]|nr:RloB domain-containing protein [Atopobiaceae bacterium]
MRDANRMGKRLRYRCAYSNLTFDLWMILHKANAVHCGHRDEYLRQINATYGTDFREMHEYKREANFKGLLSGIGLDDVASAVERAKKMNEVTMRRGARTTEHCGFTYCLDNPYTELHDLVGEMLGKTRALPVTGRRGR